MGSDSQIDFHCQIEAGEHDPFGRKGEGDDCFWLSIHDRNEDSALYTSFSTVEDASTCANLIKIMLEEWFDVHS